MSYAKKETRDLVFFHPRFTNIKSFLLWKRNRPNSDGKLAFYDMGMDEKNHAFNLQALSFVKVEGIIGIADRPFTLQQDN